MNKELERQLCNGISFAVKSMSKLIAHFEKHDLLSKHEFKTLTKEADKEVSYENNK